MIACPNDFGTLSNFQVSRNYSFHLKVRLKNRINT